MDGLRLMAGCVVLLLSTLAVADTSRRVVCHLWPGDVLTDVTAGLVVGIAEIILIVELLGTVGLLKSVAMLVLAAAGWVAAWRWIPLGHSDSRPPAGDVQSRLAALTLPSGLALVAVVILGVVAVGASLLALYQPHTDFDAISFHLPVAVQWFQRGNIRFLPYESPVSLSAHYPGNAELLALWLIVPTGRDFLVQLASLPGLALAMSATAMIARRLGARPLIAALAALLVPTLPRALHELVGTNMQDMVYVGAVVAVAAIAFLHARDPKPRPATLLLAGLAAGIAVGTRYAATVSLAPILLLYLIPPLKSSERWRRIATTVGFIGAGTLIVGAYFYIRNQVLTGTPIYPQSVVWKRVSATEKINFHLFRSYVQLGIDPHAWKDGIRYMWRADGVVTAVLAFGVLLPPLLALLRKERDLWSWAWALLPAAATLAFLGTPGSAGYYYHGQLVPSQQASNLRYGVYVLSLSAAVLAAELSRLRRETAELLGAAIGFVAIIITYRHTHSVILWRVLGSAGVLGVIGLLVVGALWLRSRMTAAVAAVAALAVAVLVTPALAHHYDRRRLAAALPFEKQQEVLTSARHSIAIEGICPMYGLYGPRLDRRVEFLTGADHQVNRPLFATYDAWKASIDEHHVTAVVVGTTADACFGTLNLPYGDWIRDHPGVFSLIYRDASGSVFRVRPV